MEEVVLPAVWGVGRGKSVAGSQKHHSIVIASRASPLALLQSEQVRASLLPLGPVEIRPIVTTGDRILDRQLTQVGGKGLFTRELEQALLDSHADLAVHSMKDVPTEMSPRFALLPVLQREDPRDAFVSERFCSLESMPEGARVGTSSSRRAAQLGQFFPHLQVVPLRGNVATRLAKLDEGHCDALVLAVAGLKRLGLASRIRCVISMSIMLPAPGQGALGVQVLASRTEFLRQLQVLSDPETEMALMAERTVSRLLGGSCRVPLAAHCSVVGGRLQLEVQLLTNDRVPRFLSVQVLSAAATLDGASRLGYEAFAQLQGKGVLAW